MKKILFFILFLPLFSCDDWLEVESEVSVTYQNYFQSEQDIEDIFVTIFGKEKKILSSAFLTPFDWTSVYCDEVGTKANGYRTLDPAMYTNNIDWNGLYQVIYLANLLEENQNRFQNISKERTDFWIAQANFFKGLMYFEIARRWGDAPIAPATEDATQKAKSPVDTILALAIRSAEAALTLPTHDKLTDAKGAKVTSRQYASLGTVHTLLANIYAWMGGLYNENKYWEKAEQEASLVIDGKVGAYALVSMEDLVEKTLGVARDVTEVIHSIELNGQDEDRYNQGFFNFCYPGMVLLNYPFTTTNPKNVETINDPRIQVASVEDLYTDKKDLRRKEYWLNLGEPIEIIIYNEQEHKNDTVDYYPPYAYINKWRTPVYSVNPTVNEGGRVLITMECNRVYWRLADLILLRAECRTHLGNTNGAVKEDLNRIRERAGLPGYTGPTDKTTLLKEIFDERDRELFGETCRYYDVVRNGYFRDLFEGNFRTLTDGDVKDGALYLPVSENAFMKNTLMKQNVYWLWHLQ